MRVAVLATLTAFSGLANAECVRAHQKFPESLDGDLFQVEGAVAYVPGANMRKMKSKDIAPITQFFDTQVSNCIINGCGCPFNQEPGGFFAGFLGCDFTCSLEVSSDNINTWHMDDFQDLDVFITQSAMECFMEYPYSSVSFHVFAVQGHNQNPGLSSKWKYSCEPARSCPV